MIFLVPIGVPLIFLMLMYKAKSELPDGRPNSTVLGGAKLCRQVTAHFLLESHQFNQSSALERRGLHAAGLATDCDRSSELDDDQDRYGFLCRDLRPE
jgi:hypothetical protein